MLEFRHAGLAHDDLLWHFNTEVDGELVAKPNGDILDGLTRHNELTVGTEKHMRIQLGHQVVQSLRHVESLMIQRDHLHRLRVNVYVCDVARRQRHEFVTLGKQETTLVFLFYSWLNYGTEKLTNFQYHSASKLLC